MCFMAKGAFLSIFSCPNLDFTMSIFKIKLQVLNYETDVLGNLVKLLACHGAWPIHIRPLVISVPNFGIVNLRISRLCLFAALQSDLQSSGHKPVPLYRGHCSSSSISYQDN